MRPPSSKWGVVLAFCLFGVVHAWGQVLNEDYIKANYLLGFPRFVRWNETAKPTTIGVVGADRLADLLREALTARENAGMAADFTVRVVRAGESLEGLQVLYIDPSLRDSWAEWIELAGDFQILVVGQGDGFIEAGGMIELVVRRNKLKYRLNAEAAERVGVGFSSKLFDLALKDQ